MTLSRKMIASGLATLAVLVTTAAASAAPAVTTNNVNVRSGPGTGYYVVDTLLRGDRVEIDYCRGSWCYVVKPGPDGWVSSNYLSSGRPSWDDDYGGGWDRPRPPRPPVYDPYPPRPPHWDPRPPRPHYPYPVRPGRPDASFCFNGPNGYFCAGS